MSTQAPPGNFPGGRRWHASLPALAAAFSGIALVATVGFAGFAARQLSRAAESQSAVAKLRDQLNGATSHLERANRLLGATAKVVQAAAEVQRIDQTLAEQRKAGVALQKTTSEAIAALKADKGLKGAAREKSIAKLKNETKAQLEAMASKEKDLMAQRDPLAVQLSEELGRMLATFADEASKLEAAKAPPPAVAAPEAPAEGETPDQEPAAAVDASAKDGAQAQAGAEDVREPAEDGGAGAPAADGGEAAAKTATRPGREGTGIGAGKQVEP